MAKGDSILTQAVSQNGEREAAKASNSSVTKPLIPSNMDEVVAEVGIRLRTVKNTSEPRRNADTAFELLDRAARAFDVLVSRFQRIEQELVEVTDRAEAQAHEAASTIEQWRQISSALKDQLENADRKSGVLKSQIDAAEARAENAESRLKILERSAALAVERVAAAEELSTKLHDKIVVSFGIGSRMHVVFDAITKPAKALSAPSVSERSQPAAAS